MNLKLNFSKLYSVLLVALFFVGFQSTASAQLTIKNDSDCSLWVAGVQATTASLGNPCGACTLLPLTRVAPGQSIGLLINTSCGPEYWKEVLYSISATGNPVASSANPSGLCGPDVGSVDCLGSTITATWSIAGAGNATVSLK